ncbi:MAG: triose-phosphate isomerase [Bacteroidales bacterium]|jgi:triosephosphate isomerase
MREKIVAGNWKMNTSVAEGVQLAREVLAGAAQIPERVQVILAPPFTHLYPIAQLLEGQSRIALAAQNCAEEAKGAYTGEVSAGMLASVPCSYVILGHSERRMYYGETDETLWNKLCQALANGLRPIFCVGELLEEREANQHFQVVASQLKHVIGQLQQDDFEKIIIAYEPVWAIGTGKTATSDQAQEMHAFIRSFLAGTFGRATEKTPILYGGSCNPSNAKELFSQPDIDGGLIGGASLKANDFLAVAKAFE